jgi:tetratricopeptide (TPR) repeat protein
LANRPLGQMPVAPDGVRDSQVTRQRIEDGLLSQWGQAFEDGDGDLSDRLLREASQAAADLAAGGADSMARDATAAINRALADKDEGTLRALARGHSLYGLARSQFLSDRLQEASVTMREAARAFGRAGSPYRLWAPVYSAIAARMTGSPTTALRDLQDISADKLPSTYFNLRGRLLWTQGAAYASLGRYDIARGLHGAAVQLYQKSGELENLSANETYVSEADWFLGDRPDAWAHERAALDHLDRLPMSSRRIATLYMGAFFSLGDHLPEVGLEFQNALVRSVEDADFKVGRPIAYMQRARILAELGDHRTALADLVKADAGATLMEDVGLRERTEFQIRSVRAEVLSQSDPKRAREDVEAAIAYLRRSSFGAQVATVLMLKARILEAQGDSVGAIGSLEEAARAFESDRAGLSSMQARVEAFEGERRTFRELLRLHAVTIDADLRHRINTWFADIAAAVPAGTWDDTSALGDMADDIVANSNTADEGDYQAHALKAGNDAFDHAAGAAAQDVPGANRAQVRDSLNASLQPMLITDMTADDLAGQRPDIIDILVARMLV